MASGGQTLRRYLVEVERPELGWSQLQELPARVRASAAELRLAGQPVRFLRSILVPEDETCFLLFEGDRAETVHAAVTGAGLSVGELVRPEPGGARA